MGNFTSNSTKSSGVFSPISTTAITPTPTVLSMSTSIVSSVTEPTQNLITKVGTTACPSSGLDLKQRLLFVLLGSLFGIILILVIVAAVMCKYGKKDNRNAVTPLSTDASDEPNEHELSAPPRPVWSNKSQNKNKK